MKRSQIEYAIQTAHAVCRHFGEHLPPFADWSRADWESRDERWNEIRDCMLGWDVTDFGSGRYDELGRVLFTLRNGRSRDEGYPKGYAEKLLIDPENQRAPAHFHRSKREDIICRHGGNIIVQLQQASPDDNPSDDAFDIQLNGGRITLQPQACVRLEPGDSLTIPPRTIHQFWGEEGTGWAYEGQRYTLSSEISSVCDDWNDNVFMVAGATRFPEIEEDASASYYLCHEYPPASPNT